MNFLITCLCLSVTISCYCQKAISVLETDRAYSICSDEDTIRVEAAFLGRTKNLSYAGDSIIVITEYAMELHPVWPILSVHVFFPGSTQSGIVERTFSNIVEESDKRRIHNDAVLRFENDSCQVYLSCKKEQEDCTIIGYWKFFEAERIPIDHLLADRLRSYFIEIE